MRAIFLSYRREDAEGQAGRLFDDLTRYFGDDAVFMDVAAIDAGRDFRRAIDEQVASCGVLLAMIGKSWLTATDESGARRLDNPKDFVRLETASALKRDIPVVPVMVHGARMPRAEDLPEDLRDLAFRNGVELTHARWDSDVEVLVKALRPYVQTTQVPTNPRAQPAPSEQGQGRTGLSRRMIAVLVSVLVLAIGGYLGYQKHPDVDTGEPAAVSGEKSPAAAVEEDVAKVEPDGMKKDEIAANQATTTARPPKEEASTQAGDAPSFQDWQGSWNLQWELEGTWSGKTMSLKSHQAGIFGDYEIGLIEGSFVDGDFTEVTGEYTNTAGTGQDCSYGKQGGRFLFKMSNDGTRMDGWWDVCGEGKKREWKADKRNAELEVGE